MDTRKGSRIIHDPKVRQVGFIPPQPPLPDHTQSVSMDSTLLPISVLSLLSNSLTPVLIPPRHHATDSLSIPRRHPPVDIVHVGSYNPSGSVLATSLSPSTSYISSKFGDGEFSEDVSKISQWSNSAKSSSSFPRGGFDMTFDVKAEKVEVALMGVQNEKSSNVMSLKVKTTKAERRALQESQRAAKAAAKGTNSVAGKPAKTSKQPSQNRNDPIMIASEKKGVDLSVEKDRKKEVPAPRMQFDDKSRVEKAKRRAVVKQVEARNRVDFFRHLPQYEHGSQLADLQSKFFLLDSDTLHPAVYEVGLKYLAGDVVGGNARCIALLLAFKEAIHDYSTPPEKTFAWGLTSKISTYVSFLTECRPLSISMGNAIKFIKSRITKLPPTISEPEAKSTISSDIARFISDKIISADTVIVDHAVMKIGDGDVVLTFGSSTVVEMLFLRAHELGRRFRVVVVDSRPRLEGRSLTRRLVGKGLKCDYTHVNAVSYVMREVSRVFLGAASVLSNGTVYSRVGTACVAMAAHALRVPVLVCCEAYKFHERVQLDSVSANELGDPNAISKVPGRTDIDSLNDWASMDNLQLLNLLYDATPSDYISMIVTDYGMVPPTSVPVIVRDYQQEESWL